MPAWTLDSEVNNGFSSEKIKVQVSLIKKEEKAETTALAEAPVERKHVLDAAIVRIMKSRNRLERLRSSTFSLISLVFE